MIEAAQYDLRLTGPAKRQLHRLSDNVAVAIENPYRVGGLLQRELAGFHSARRGAYRIVYEILEAERVVVVHRIDHRAHIYRPR
jgi:mRNA interferase RelE/StbE